MFTGWECEREIPVVDKNWASAVPDATDSFTSSKGTVKVHRQVQQQT
jgi:hypothetical protein